MSRLLSHKNHIIALIAAIAGFILPAALMITSCSDELEPPFVPSSRPEAGYITIDIRCGEISSRAEEGEPGIDNLNENMIRDVIVCLSPAAGNRTDDDAPAYIQPFTDIDKNGVATLRIPLTTEIITRLFGENSSDQCRIFAAVNLGYTPAENEHVTVAQLRAMTVNSTFETEKTQHAFTMDGDGTVSYSRAGNYAVGEVKVRRSAAKITLALDVDQNVEEIVGGQKLTWQPNLAGMRVKLQQGVKISTLDPAPVPDMAPEVYFNSSDELIYGFEAGTQPSPYEAFNQIQDTPFYTYPNRWTDSASERHSTFLMLSVPWSSDGGKTYRTCYYHVPIIPFNEFELVRNISYHVNLHVGVLGSFVPEEPLEVKADYFAAEWGSTDLDVDIADYRYLVVDQNDFIVNNENSITIPFYTSHDTDVIDVKMTFYRYNYSDQGTEFAVTVTKDHNNLTLAKNDSVPVFTANFDNTNNTLTITHDLIIWEPYDANDKPVDLTNDVESKGENRQKTQTKAQVDAMLSKIAYFKPQAAREGFSTKEFSRVEFEVTVQHMDVTSGEAGIDTKLYKETVKITQFPGIYITAVPNNSDLLGQRWSSGAMGNTIINGRYDPYVTDAQTDVQNARQTLSNYTNWDYSLGLSSGYQNWNPNLYLITITQLEIGTPYTIDDPRSTNINNDLSNNYGTYTVDGGTENVWATEYWARDGTDNNWKVSRLTNPTQAQIDKIKSGIGTHDNGGTINSPNKKLTWDQGFILDGFTTAPAKDEDKPRTLRYYYPTREDDDNKYTIAPKFRICSSYGGSSPYMTREMGRRRAAAYQELGYYAGRWRLPTYGEVTFVMELSRQHKIPRLFGRNSGVWYYWCAQGAVLVPDRKNTNNYEIRIVAKPSQDGNPAGGSNIVGPFSGDNYRDHVRFVYDEWYWGDETIIPSANKPNENTPIYEFTWGDKYMSNPQKPKK